MARSINNLNAQRVRSLTKPGMYGDGNGLYLQVGPEGNQSWSFRYMIKGKPRKMGLGSIHTFTLAEAREAARMARQTVHAGIDPLAVKAAQKAEAAQVLTFEQCAERFIAAHRASWRSPKHAEQLTSTLRTYAYPTIGKLPVQDVDTRHVMAILEPIWNTKNVTAVRVMGRIKAILDWAKAGEFRKGDNPAAWDGHLDHLLASPAKVSKTKHHPAVPFLELPTFMARLRALDSISARALEFTILTAARTGETIYAVDGEVDFATSIWTVPPNRTKSGREHRVPLCTRAVEILKTTPREKGSDFLFSGFRRTRGLSNMAMLELLRGMEGYGQYVVHGFRSTFRDWAGDMTAYPPDLIETALAHVIKDKTEAAYRRSDALEKRARLMADWGAYCAAPAILTSETVTPIRAVV